MQECFDKFNKAYPTPSTYQFITLHVFWYLIVIIAREKHKPTKEKDIDLKLSSIEDASQLGGKGTNKRKRILRNLSKKV